MLVEKIKEMIQEFRQFMMDNKDTLGLDQEKIKYMGEELVEFETELSSKTDAELISNMIGEDNVKTYTMVNKDKVAKIQEVLGECDAAKYIKEHGETEILVRTKTNENLKWIHIHDKILIGMVLGMAVKDATSKDLEAIQYGMQHIDKVNLALDINMREA